MKLSIKYMLLLIIIFVMLFSYSIIMLAQEFEEDSLETNIILLEIRVNNELKESDSFFEVLVFPEDNYYLIPVNLMSSYLEVNINYNRENNLLTIANPVNNKEIRIDLEERKYLNNEEWSLEPPLIFDGDFFISPSVVEYLYDINFEWSPSYQLLTVRGDYFKSDDEKRTEDLENIDSNLNKKDEYDLEAQNFSLGSIHYKLSLNYHNYYLGGELIELSEDLKLHSRLFDWAVSIEGKGKTDLIEEDTNFELTKLIGEYREDEKLIIVGDYGVDFPKTIGEKSVRGIYYRYPERSISDVFAYTSVQGETNSGSIIKLFVNDKKYKQISIEENNNKYYFENIPLLINRLNNLKVVVTDSDGNETILEKNIVGSPRILQEGLKEKEFSAGLYKNPENEKQEGVMLGLKYKNAPTSSFTYDIESVGKKTNEEKEVNYLLSPSVAFRLGNNKVITVDWYITENDENNHGGEMSASYFMYNSYIKLIYSYIPVKVSDGFQKEEGKNTGLIGVWDFSKNWDLRTDINYIETLIPNNIYNKKSINLSLLYNNEIFTHFAIGLSYEDILSLYESSFDESKVLGTNKRYGLNLANDIYRENLKFKFRTSLYDNNIEFNTNSNKKYQDFNIVNVISKKLTDKILIKNDFEGNSQIYNFDFYNTEITNNTDLVFNIKNNNKISLFSEYNKDDVDDENIYAYGISYKHYFNNNIFLDLGSSYNETTTSFDYQRYFLRFNYRINNNSNIYFYYNNNSYRQQKLIDQQAYEVTYSKTFPSEKELNIFLGKELNGLFNDNSDYYLTVSLSHALNFSGENILNQHYNSFGHKSLISGIVYLDENNNRKYDNNEKKLPNIKMSLDGLTALTDEKGLYKFEVNFPGIYELKFDYNSLVTDYTPITIEKKVKVDKNSNIYYNFGLTMNGTISGQVYKDENGNGELDINEELIQWVGIVLNNKKTIYTDNNGEFYFENVPLGQHELTFIEESFPSSMRVRDKNKIVVDITKNSLDVKNIDVPLVYAF